jgi:beta-galactosidase
LLTDVYINGNFVGEHQGAFAAFVFDVTPYLNVGGDNVIAVKVNNSFNPNVPPLGGDFNVDGGIYRDVHLLVTDPVHITPLDYGSPGVYLIPNNVSASSANLQITTLVSNANPANVSVNVVTVIADGASNIVKTLTNSVELPGTTLSNIVANTQIPNPHLWNGIFDPYLYRATVQIWNGTNLLDAVTQPLGFRSFSLDPNLGFFLNGQSYPLHGVSMHEDWLDCGWALTSAQRETNFMLIKNIGATCLRLAHWQHNAETYRLADQNGIVIETEVPLVNNITASTAFSNNAVQQMRELIRQNYNHPSIFFWGIFNEITHQAGPISTHLDSAMARLVALEDPTRVSSSASSTPESKGRNNFPDSDPSNWYSDATGFNKYFGWYTSSNADFSSWADTMHSNYPARFIGVTEYGAGGSIYQHSEDPVAQPNSGGPFHPEEWENLLHESHWRQMQARPFLWGTFVWAMFDFASDSRNEGDHPGLNDKGLVTYDRQICKDAYYFYQASWTTNAMVYITGHTFTNRFTNNITAKIYANCDSVQLIVNGVSQGSHAGTNSIFLWPIALASGTNIVQAIGIKGSSKVTDSLIWIAPVTPPATSVHSPTASPI